MNYFAGNPSNTSKFMHASFDPTTFTNLSQGVEAMQEAAARNADFKRGYAALGGFSKAQEMLANYEAEKEIAKIAGSAQKQSNLMSGLGTAISLGGAAFGAAGGLGGVDRAFNADLSAGLTGNEFANAPSQFGGGVNFFGT